MLQKHVMYYYLTENKNVSGFSFDFQLVILYCFPQNYNTNSLDFLSRYLNFCLDFKKILCKLFFCLYVNNLYPVKTVK